MSNPSRSLGPMALCLTVDVAPQEASTKVPGGGDGELHGEPHLRIREEALSSLLLTRASGSPLRVSAFFASMNA